MFEIYGHDQCSWCTKAKELLDSRGLKYTYHNIREDSKAMAEFRFLFRDAKTVPQIATGMYDEVRVIGGYEALTEYLAKN
jgi:glutaredoxin